MRVVYRGNVEERFWPRVDQHGPVPAERPDLGPCWIWQGRPSREGYGRIGLDGGRHAPVMLVHRFVYELLVGPIPDGLTLDHLCRVRLCVNPAHLEPVTRGENVMRGVGFAPENARKTHCPHGHEYDVANTWISPKGYRNCRACNREKARRRHRARRV